MPHKSDERLARGTLPRRHLACLTKAPFGASLTPCPRHNIPANLVVQLESSRLPAPTKSWLDRDVSFSGRTHGTAFGGVRGSQGGLGEQSQTPLVPLAAAAAAALRTVLRSVRSAALRRHLACLTKAPFGASLTPCPRHNIPANLVVQLESSRLPAPTKSWLDRDVSFSGRTHGTAFGGVRGSQGGLGEQSQAPLVPLAAAAAAALRAVPRLARGCHL